MQPELTDLEYLDIKILNIFCFFAINAKKKDMTWVWRSNVDSIANTTCKAQFSGGIKITLT